jgi:hypothetical protein
MQKIYTYRITADDNAPVWESTYRGAVKKQKELYAKGAERIQINKEFLR